MLNEIKMKRFFVAFIILVTTGIAVKTQDFLNTRNAGSEADTMPWDIAAQNLDASKHIPWSFSSLAEGERGSNNESQLKYLKPVVPEAGNKKNYAAIVVFPSALPMATGAMQRERMMKQKRITF